MLIGWRKVTQLLEKATPDKTNPTGPYYDQGIIVQNPMAFLIARK